MPDFIAALLTPELGLAALSIILAAVVRGYTGSGGGLVNVPILTLLYGPIEAFALTTLVGIIGYLQLGPRALRLANRAELAPVCLAILVGGPLGVLLLFLTDPALVRRFIGLMVLIGAVLLTTGWTYRGRRGPMVGAAVGLLIGWGTGFAGSGAPIALAYFLATDESARVKRANIVVAMTVVTALVLGSIAVGGGVGWDTLARGFVLVPVSWLGTRLGWRIFEAAPQAIYRHVCTGLLYVIGVVVLVS